MMIIIIIGAESHIPRTRVFFPFYPPQIYILLLLSLTTSVNYASKGRELNAFGFSFNTLSLQYIIRFVIFRPPSTPDSARPREIISSENDGGEKRKKRKKGHQFHQVFFLANIRYRGTPELSTKTETRVKRSLRHLLLVFQNPENDGSKEREKKSPKIFRTVGILRYSDRTTSVEGVP